MSKWPIFKIRDLVANYIGGGWGNDEANNEFSEPAFVIRGTDIPPLKTGTVNPDIYRYHKPSNLRSRTLVEGDIVFEVSGGSAGQPLGRNALITESILAKFDAPVMCASFCKMIRPNRDVVEPAFLQRLFDYLLHVEKIQQFEVQSTGISNYQFEDFLDYQKIPLPPLPLQRQIAAVLGRYDALLENYQAQVAALEALAQELYREWFVRGRCPGVPAGPNGELPAGWEVRKFTDVISVLSGGTPKTSEPNYWDGDIYWFSPGDAGNTYYVLTSEKTITELGLKNCNSKLYPIDTVIITARGTVGKCVLLGRPMAINQSNYALVGKSVSQYFTYFKTLELAEGLQQEANGAVFSTITTNNFERADIVVPNSKSLAAFDEKVTPLFQAIRNYLLQSEALRATRDALLPRLLSGQLVINEQLVMSNE